MRSATERRLARLEQTMAPPAPLQQVMLIAADDPEAERLMAEHEEWRPDRPAPSLIILTGVPRATNGLVS